MNGSQVARVVSGALMRAPAAPQWLAATAPAPQLWEALQSASGAARKIPGFLLQLQQRVRAGEAITLAAAQYLAETAVGQSPNTLAAKCRDLLAFIAWFVQINQHADPAQWLARDTRLFLRDLEAAGRSPVSINRSLATLRHFARWLHEQPGATFIRTGLPTRGIRELHTEEADCKKLGSREVHALFKAADNLVTLARHGRARPRRNRALLAVLFYTGLRVQELVALRLQQLQGSHLQDVVRKGRVRSRSVYLVADCRRFLDDYLEHERPRDASPSDPGGEAGLFLAQGDRAPLSRRDVARALQQLADEANKRRQEPIHLHPHRLRHTFGANFRAKCESDSETAAALGHTSLKYVGRYTRRSDAERRATLDALFGDEQAAAPLLPPGG